MREVVEEIVEAGRPYSFGLEAGSKAELQAVLALNTNEDSLTILNGHKDDEYLRLGLLGRRLGREVIIVIERPSELERPLRLGREMGIEPILGLRINLGLRPVGRWQDSSGERSPVWPHRARDPQGRGIYGEGGCPRGLQTVALSHGKPGDGYQVL